MASIEEKKSKNMLWVGIISICMIFAGFTSAYLVSKTDNFWVEVQQPWWFMVSTIVIVISSLTFYLAKRAAASDNKPMIKVWMAITLLLGMSFTYTQFKGWGELTEKGYFFVGPIKAPGTYGENVVIYKDGKPFDFDGSRFYYDGKPIEGELKEEFNALAEELSKLDGRKREHDLSQFPEYKIDVFYLDSAK